uniref:BED-type domain-containing protein n=1 Tax=Heterorhabditis bacteriophora TaxID=37862 RepID=A0A1I7WMM4_HETBA
MTALKKLLRVPMERCHVENTFDKKEGLRKSYIIHSHALLTFSTLFQRSKLDQSKKLIEYFLGLLALQDEVDEETVRRKRPGHPVWSYFQRVDRFDAICLLCGSRVKSACSTNLSRHLRSHHLETAVEVMRSWKGKAPSSTEAKELSEEAEDERCVIGRGVIREKVDRDMMQRAESVEKCVGDRGGTVACAQSAAGMNSGEGDAPACPVAIHPYGMGPTGTLSMAPMGPTGALGSDLAGLGLAPSLTLSNIEIANSWCQFPTAYHDLRPVDHSNYDAEVAAINYHELTANQKYDHMKYDYSDIRAKQFEETRLYHKEPDTVVKEEEKMSAGEYEEKGDLKEGATPAKRGRPTENPCWNYFIRLDDQNVRCRLCNKVVKSACATNMTKHLERHHQQDYQHLIVQIKQYRQQKGPVLSSGPLVSAGDVQQSTPCLLPTSNHFVKTEPYATELYSPQYERDNVLRNFSTYDRQEQPLPWHRAQWGHWPSAHDPSTSNIDMTGGVILHGALASAQGGGGWTPTSPGTSGTQDKPYMKRNRKTEHPVWEYFKRTPDGNAQCGICTGIVKSPCSSNFMRHLMRHHSTEYNSVYVKWVQKRGPNNERIIRCIQ